MSSEYRIIKQHDDFIVQRKHLWWWSTMKHAYHAGDALFLSRIDRFDTIEAARDFIELKRPKQASPIHVVETRIIW